jgi:hypothetical protein
MTATTIRAAARRSWAPTVALGGHRDFRLLWMGQLTSELGSSISGVAMPLLALALTGSQVLAGALGTVSFVAIWLSSVPGGYLADRYDARRLLVTCDAVSALTMAIIGVAVAAGAASIWLLGAAAAVLSVTDMVFGPGVSRALRAIVRVEQVPEAVAVTQARSYAADMAGPSAGGLLFAFGRAFPFAVDAASYVVSLACTLSLQTGLEPARPPAGKLRFLPAVGAGWTHVRRDSFLRSTTVYSAVMNVASSTLLFVVILGEGDTPGGAVVVGTTLSLAAAAGLLGSAVAPLAQRRFGLRAVLTGVAAGRAVLILAAAAIGGSLALALALASVLLTKPVIGGVIAAARMVLVPKELFGRVIGTSSFVATALQPGAPLLAGIMIHGLSRQLALVALASTFAVAAVLSVLAGGLGVDLREWSREG